MRVDIWSDVMCPFCYIGKRKFETALAAFPDRKSVEVVWHSFQINPTLAHQPDKDFYTYVAELKGQSREWSIRIHESLIQTAKSVGLDYRLDQAKITNSFDAHRVIQLAKKDHLTNEVEERFFKAYFTEGALMSDHATLIKLAVEAGLAEHEVRQVLDSDRYADDVKKDGEKVKSLGASGVPFFLMNQKYAVSGAQTSEFFTETLTRAFKSWRADNPASLEINNGPICTPEGKCE
ncbi:disulfide bond formation protein DsbA [Pedobacter steynii]|uniref:Disulfide bond formation protein DsbA n=2 Tax=Pedobacter steynii TaxID=430522 RepID=A0A1D7QQL0_9SPHI|nr:disulfide bond formation protein DsbA [Pedobacter steynii]